MIPALLVDAVAGYRLTKLATDDVITAPIRDRLVAAVYRRAEDEIPPDVDVDVPNDWTSFAIGDPVAPKMATLLTCRWCAGMWIGFGVVAARRLAPRAWAPIADALAVASAAALLAGLEDG